MKKNIVLLMVALCLLLVILSQGDKGVVYSQDDIVEPMPGFVSEPGLGQVQNEDGLWFMPAGGETAVANSPQAVADSGGPDDFGYTWTDNVTLDWVSASGGVDTGLGSGGYPDYTGAVSVGFSFKFYENTYQQLYISRYGFLSFDNTNLGNRQSNIPSPEPPDNVIAPHWVPADDANYIRYLRGGSAPNRWFVVEWNQLRSDYNDLDMYTFETILYENGNILFQYDQMNTTNSYYCQAGGIEDMTGLDGLNIKEFCQPVASNHAVRISRPSAAVRVKISPQYGGSFAHSGQVETFELNIRNTGEFGVDTYDLFPGSPLWSTALYKADGVTPLTDTDGDSVIDTGPISQAGQTTIVAKVQTPVNATVGDNSTLNLLVRSSVNTSVSKTAQIRTAVPTRFGQISQDNADSVIDLSLYQPAGRTQVALSPENHYGSDLAVTNTPDDGFFTVWTRGRSSGTKYVEEIIYTIADKHGEIVQPAAKLTKYDNATVYIYDYDPAVAVTPDGHLGVLWVQQKYDSSNGFYNYNIFFAILSEDGNLIYGPANLTNNNLWGEFYAENVPFFHGPHLTATTDSRFVFTWQRQSYQNNYYSDIVFYGIRSNSGVQIHDISAFTGDDYGNPNLTTLSSNRVLLLMTSYQNNDIMAAILDSNGNTIHGLTNISNDGSSYYDYNSDAAQLTNGNILVSWTGNTYGEPETHQIRYSVLNSNLGVVSGAATLNNPASLLGDGYVSIAPGPDSTGVLTWQDYDYYRPNLYYALVGGSGALLTSPTIIESSEASVPYLVSSFTGYGNAAYTWAPPVEPDPTLNTEQTIQGAAPGGATAIFADFANYGESETSGLTLTAVLGSNLTYEGDDSGITPTVTSSILPNSGLAVAETVTWALPDMRLFDRNGFSIFVGLADTAPIGSSYPVTLTLTSDSDADLSNNQHTVMVWSSRQVYLPMVGKPFD